jgi:hypothetical protein
LEHPAGADFAVSHYDIIFHGLCAGCRKAAI